MKEVLHISTMNAPVGQRHRFWTDQVAAYLSTMEIDVRRKIDFQGSIALRPLGAARIALVDAEYQSVTHRADGRDDRLQLSLVDQGGMEVRRFGQTLTLSQGDWCLLDERESYSFVTSPRCACIVMQMPGPWARRLMPDPGGSVIAGTSCDPHWQRALALGLRAVGSHQASSPVMDDDMLAEQLGNLLALAMSPHAIKVDGRQRGALLRAIRRSMLERHNEPHLGASQIAYLNKISVRYLHKLFASAGTTFGHELLQLRLASAKRLLADQRYIRVSVGEISSLSGFATPEAFTRHFKGALGVTPRKYRQETLK
ncbi:AraC-like DNA-binding protein [Novosphingobium hassiacum]|uniref:AraC-like DNA-binding protein n=1 Tax=Novosphingobium hassiacum TaxID=173676 RepID=A0A7W5ZTI8_9SPHN|nr:AraC family transcriptional regulator [Novosphingobium hassiacum]MBB3858808.1 AraC-like DNA-binding protein [Novosphingobium hassiacum]